MNSYSVLGISGSLRKESSNIKLLNYSGNRLKRLNENINLTIGDINFPLYNDDTEKAEGLPNAVVKLGKEISSSSAVLISTPEYNKGISGSLKNCLDWLSRIKPNPLTEKNIAILSATDGRSGGERSQYMLRHCLVTFNCKIIQTPEVLISGASNAFSNEGKLIDQKSNGLLDELLEKLYQGF
jgi:chromate reductase